jgi:2-methylcitrate dehydratase PrpD
VTDPISSIASYTLQDGRGAFQPRVAAQAKRLLLDGISWMVLGSRRAEARPLLDVAARSGTNGDCTVIGSPTPAPFLDALFANTALTQVHDCNDGRRLARRDGGSNHPGRCVIPAALTLGQHHHLAGPALLDLVITGYEIASRARVSHVGMEYSFTVAAMMAKAAGLGAESTQRALTLAGLTYPMVGDAEPHDTDFDFLAHAFIARAAATAALAADVARTLPVTDQLVSVASPFPMRGAPGGYEILNVSIKPYPCCRALHGAIDLAREVRAIDGVRASEIVEVEVRTGNRKAFLFESASPDATHKRCQFSIPYATACALLDGEVGESSFERARIAAADVAALQARIRCVFDPALEFNPVGFASHFRPSALTVITNGGTTWTRETVSPRGSPMNPLNDAELRAKFDAWTGASLAPGTKEEVASMVRDLEAVEDVAALMERLRVGYLAASRV